jgi:3-oxoacyl-[acyl-carrier protein] reductase
LLVDAAKLLRSAARSRLSSILDTVFRPDNDVPALDFGRNIVETGLAGRSALVSGGSKGIGKGIARALAREGANIALLARTEHEVLAAAQEIAGETGVTVVGVQADVTDTNSLKEAVAHLSSLASFSALNIVVNNAAPPITRADRQIEWCSPSAPLRQIEGLHERRISGSS